LVLLLACASSRQGHLGTLAVKPVNAVLPPITFSVGRGRVVGSHLDVRIEDNGCMRGTFGSSPLVLCGERDANGVEHWSGASGNFMVQPLGNAVRVDGWLMLRVGQQVPIAGTIPLGQGPQWDELREHPGLLAIAAMAAELGR
jgi:hypothetical protein